MPEIKVTHQRLDEEGVPPIFESPGTNAYSVRDGWLMIAGIDPQTAGCWKVTAGYRGASSSYVYQSGQWQRFSNVICAAVDPFVNALHQLVMDLVECSGYGQLAIDRGDREVPMGAGSFRLSDIVGA
jgi:hypothetical protein